MKKHILTQQPRTIFVYVVVLLYLILFVTKYNSNPKIRIYFYANDVDVELNEAKNSDNLYTNF